MAKKAGNGGVSTIGKVLFAPLVLGGLLLLIVFRWHTQTPGSTPSHVSNNLADTYAFANSSPIVVFDSPALTGGHKENFEFGKAYEVDEHTSDYVRIKLQNGTLAYLRAAHVTTVRSPRWLATTPAYNMSERELIRFWESADRLKGFLSGANTTGSRWDYEEYFDSAPQFQLKLPILETHTGNLLNGGRQVKVISVMLPISQAMQQAFESAKSDFDKKLDLYFLVDVSGSTNEFLEESMGAFTRALSRNERLRNRVNSIVLTTFGAGRREKSTFVGKITPNELESFVWHRPRMLQASIGEREPLIDGLVAIGRGVRSDSDGIPVLIIMSGADVELAGYVASQGKSLTIENLDLKLSTDAAAIFVQITPEPGDDLRNASRQFPNVSRIIYLEYSDVLADDIVSNLLKITESLNARAVAAKALGTVAKAAHEKQTMAFLPRVLNSTSGLPTRQSYAKEADWYTARLWLAVHELIWKETAE